jgi:hypothetical protein
MPRQMSLVEKTAFRRHIGQRAPFANRKQRVGMPQPATEQVLVRRESHHAMKQPVEMESA